LAYSTHAFLERILLGEKEKYGVCHDRGCFFHNYPRLFPPKLFTQALSSSSHSTVKEGRTGGVGMLGRRRPMRHQKEPGKWGGALAKVVGTRSSPSPHLDRHPLKWTDPSKRQDFHPPEHNTRFTIFRRDLWGLTERRKELVWRIFLPTAVLGRFWLKVCILVRNTQLPDVRRRLQRFAAFPHRGTTRDSFTSLRSDLGGSTKRICFVRLSAHGTPRAILAQSARFGTKHAAAGRYSSTRRTPSGQVPCARTPLGFQELL
jgi:hypothetical protein